ncbi:DUF84 family protein [Gracilibacillus sp. JCM 18860]|uniref:DUF84 family protein n=1 Tax=Gracilibacillus sp. JCM 18860 TaxID=1306159 RepID=UPI0006D24034
MNMIVGSFNKAKVNAVKRVFTEASVESKEVSSQVSGQPRSEEETLEGGAINRARACRNDTSFGIGLEGGVTYLNNQLFLCNWGGALVTPSDELFIASGAKIPLPEIIEQKLVKGLELSEIMANLTHEEDIRHHLGAIGVFTNGEVSREEMFVHVSLLLKGQYQSSHIGKKN